MNPDIIVSPVVGGIIGAFANWLAITMLFFPLKEKKIFGKTIPFTPGIIPRERKRIAKSVADTVANYFLSEDVIVNAVVSADAERQFKEYIGDIIKSQQASEEKVGELVKTLTGKELKEITTGFEDKIIEFVSGQIKSPAVVESFVSYLKAESDKIIDKNIKDLVSAEDFESYKTILSDKLFTFANSESFKGFLESILSKEISKIAKSKKKLKDVLPAKLLDTIKAKAYVNSDKVADMIVDYATSSAVQFKLRKFLRNSFEGSFKLRMISKVVDVEKIFESIMDELVAFLENPDNHREIGQYLVTTIDSVASKKVKDIFEEYEIEINSDDIKENIEKLVGFASTKENLEGIVSEVISYDSETSIKGFLDSIDEGILQKKDQLIKNTVDTIFEKVSFEKLIKDILNSKLDEISEQKVGKLFGYLREQDVVLIQDALTSNFKRLISGESDRILKIIDVCKIVEDRINAFDIEEMENIMLGIIKKDIVKMRWFEAGIGFLIGALVPLFHWIMSKI